MCCRIRLWNILAMDFCLWGDFWLLIQFLCCSWFFYLGLSILKTIKHLWKKLKMTQRNGKAFHAHGSKEQMLLKCVYHPKEFTHLMQSLSKYQHHFSQSKKKNFPTVGYHLTVVKMAEVNKSNHRWWPQGSNRKGTLMHC